MLACLLGLAILPFSKFLHIITTPLLLMLRAAVPRQELSPANLATLRAYELDACMHCSVCSTHCSVAVALDEVPNLNILPSEKLASLMRLCGARPGKPQGRELRLIRQGAYICTSCLRCTDLCTAGIIFFRRHLYRGIGPRSEGSPRQAFVSALSVLCHNYKPLVLADLKASHRSSLT